MDDPEYIYRHICYITNKTEFMFSTEKYSISKSASDFIMLDQCIDGLQKVISRWRLDRPAVEYSEDFPYKSTMFSFNKEPTIALQILMKRRLFIFVTSKRDPDSVFLDM